MGKTTSYLKKEKLMVSLQVRCKHSLTVNIYTYSPDYVHVEFPLYNSYAGLEIRGGHGSWPPQRPPTDSPTVAKNDHRDRVKSG